MQREHLKRKVVKTGNMTLTLVDLQGELRMSIMDESSTNHQEREEKQSKVRGADALVCLHHGSE